MIWVQFHNGFKPGSLANTQVHNFGKVNYCPTTSPFLGDIKRYRKNCHQKSQDYKSCFLGQLFFQKEKRSFCRCNALSHIFSAVSQNLSWTAVTACCRTQDVWHGKNIKSFVIISTKTKKSVYKKVLHYVCHIFQASKRAMWLVLFSVHPNTCLLST